MSVRKHYEFELGAYRVVSFVWGDVQKDEIVVSIYRYEKLVMNTGHATELIDTMQKAKREIYLFECLTA